MSNKSKKYFHLSDVRSVQFPKFELKDSSLVAFSSLGSQSNDNLESSLPNLINEIPFLITRVFIITALSEVNRGSHAHYKCSQLLVCLQGECLIHVNDGQNHSQYILNQANQGLLIPPTIWAEQEYQSNTILMVFADQPYDEHDYIRDYKKFKKFRESWV